MSGDPLPQAPGGPGGHRMGTRVGDAVIPGAKVMLGGNEEIQQC